MAIGGKLRQARFSAKLKKSETTLVKYSTLMRSFSRERFARFL